MSRIILALGFALATALPAHSAQISGVASVTDGDTITIGAVRIRIHGIDAPEAGQQCRRQSGRSWQCGTAATNRMAEIADGRAADCEVRDRDVYGRIIAVCYVDGVDVGGALIDEGLAWAFLRYSEDYAEREATARSARLGIWDGKSEAPWDYRANRWERAAAAAPTPGCPIKGNINRQGEKIYHTPWSPWYDRTQIDESRGQRWFCDEAEAVDAGWRPARWR
ncbi:MAG: thermonuclease family protein [Salinarimonadaceae bacterium]|nr:MAG: thermonuclease family protein [Salinarimonadaceae bacterium]